MLMKDDYEHPRRKFLEYMLAAGAFSLGTSGLLLPQRGLAMGKVPEKLEPGKSIYDMEGEVKVDNTTASLDTKISANSVVETGDDSHIIFAVGQDAFILRDNSRLQLSGQGFVLDTLNLLKGKILSVFGKKKHAITTSTVTIGIRGTGIYVESEPDVSYVCTCYGVVDLASTTDETSKETIISEHHDSPRYIAKDGATGNKISSAPFINHTDIELMLIEELVGRTVPFMSGGLYNGPRRSY